MNNHPLLKEYLDDTLKGDYSSARLEKVTDEIMESFKANMSDKVLPEDIKKRIRPGYEITSIALHTIRKYMSKLLIVILTPTSSNSPLFAVSVQEWTTNFVEELVRLLSQALYDGVPDAAVVIKFFLQQRLSLIGLSPEFSLMGTNMLTSYIMKTYSNTQQPTVSNMQDPGNWDAAIEVDEIRQTKSEPQRPFSDAYISGGPSKKRKTSKAVNLNPQSMLQDRLQDAVKHSNVAPKENSSSITNTTTPSTENVLQAATKSNLTQKYVQQVKQDVKKRLDSDPDFDPNSNKSAQSKNVFLGKKQ